jgi:polyphenol oxidase
LSGGIVDTAAERVRAEVAAIGPGIGPCCYEVGEEVLSEFADLEGVAVGRMLDLTAVATQLLERAGVDESDASGLCTSCNPELLFSHRRDGERTGRQAGLIWRAD